VPARPAATGSVLLPGEGGRGGILMTSDRARGVGRRTREIILASGWANRCRAGRTGALAGDVFGFFLAGQWRQGPPVCVVTACLG
jgi:hypothetical protein